MVCLSLPAAQARPIVLHGNAWGISSPSHGGTIPMLPHIPAIPPVHSQVWNVSPVFNTPEPEPELEIVDVDECPTLLSAPHLCQSS